MSALPSTVRAVEFFKWVSELGWDSFIPDLIVGLATGVAVGLVLVAFERRLVDQRKQADDGRWAGRLERIEAALTAPIPFTSKSFRPDGDIADRVERLCDGITSIHPKVAGSLPELMFLGPLLEQLDALRLVADRLERAMDEMLSRAMPSPTDARFLLKFGSDYALALRERVRTFKPEEPWADLAPAEAEWNVIKIRMASAPEFHQQAAQYRALLRQIEAFRSGFVGYRSRLRWEGHKRALARIKDPNYRRPRRRDIDRENAALRCVGQPILAELMEKAHATIHGC